MTCPRPRFWSALCRASDKCQREKRKTINGDDLLWAMATLGFEDYIEPLKVYLQKYREVRTYEGVGYFGLIGFGGHVVQSPICHLDCTSD